MSSEVVTAAVSAERVREHTEFIVGNIPHRAAGSANGRRMAEYSRDAMLKNGIHDTEIHEFPAIVSFPHHADLRVESPKEFSIQANTLGHSLETSTDGIRAEIVDVGGGAFSDYQGKDARGKIILTELSYSPARHEKQRIAAIEGAVGAIMMNWGHDGNTAVPFGSVKPVWGNPTPENVNTEMPRLPCIGIARTEGLRLREMAKQGPVGVWLRTHVENGWKPIQVTVARAPAASGSAEPDDFILVGGHQDSWPGEAATDNAAGNACMIELARVFMQHRDKLRRGITFGFWSAHETGTMAGSAWFADRHWDRLRKNCVAYLQIDQPSFIGTTVWNTSSNAELKWFHQNVERRLLKKDFRWKRQAKSGDSSFFGVGIPMFHGEGGFTNEELAATANATLGWWHHSIENRLDKMDWTLMDEHIRMYAAYLWELATAPVLPFRFAPVADQIIARLAELAPAGGGIGLEAVSARATELRDMATRFDQAADEETERFGKGEGSDHAARLFNSTMKRLSRILVPLQSTAIGSYGHDPYGYTPQTTMIPCLYELPELGKSHVDEHRWMLETKLVRARNRVSDSLDDSMSLIGDTLAQLK